ncbi:MAG: ArsR family transcriptional regulator [Methanocalculus sp. MSAO_Arc1]|uniref:ArsR family transcriptional regulator n=1 Tax=Methanocalculus TaxID=71151 RepID=UPI000FF80B9E|nr:MULTISPECIES: ArsR family transcriptional regulator [unclassified Methanocalculus]MCP1663137.1 ArsR family transcriptional regulator [Methanocalculus sp. AMF5]RQD79346.1 MAG: ArsR family transcriptional regulator [Methanocalculus sp. MSAO_Arc1]
MLDHVEMSRLLDILGNRNRRRIIELLRQKPCFVTEISDRLLLSPKAVIEHLNMMEREALISFFLDERRRKYYFLQTEFDLVVSVKETRRTQRVASLPSADLRLIESLSMLRRMARARESLLDTLENLERDIEATMNEIVRMSRSEESRETDLDIIITLSHQDLTLDELAEIMETDTSIIQASLADLKARGIVTQEGDRFSIEGIYGTPQGS